MASSAVVGTSRAGLLLGLLLSFQMTARARPGVAVGVATTTLSASSTERTAQFERCVNATSGEAGRCMFAMDCFRVAGRHVGVCTKGFYFGSCCALSTISLADDEQRSTSTPSPPLPQEQNLPRVPIAVEEGNAIDGPVAALAFNPLDLSYWPDLLADFHGLVPPPNVNTHYQFPYSTFHAPNVQISVGGSVVAVSGAGTTTTTKPTSTSTTTFATTTTAPSTTTHSTTTTFSSSSSTSSSPTSSSSTSPSSTSPSSTSSWSVAWPAANASVVYVTAVDGSSGDVDPSLSSTDSWLEPEDIPTTAPTSPTPTTNITTTPAAVERNETVIFLLPKPSIADTVNRDDSITAVCGKPVYRWPKIVSGESARPGQWPWQVSLQEKTRRGYFHKCGASLLNKEWVITAAHCLTNVQPENLLVRLGGLDFASPDDKWSESKVQAFVHPRFNVQTQQFDLALLKLASPLVAYQSSMLPICLPDRDMEFDSSQSFVSGWGRLGERSPTSTKLQYVGVPIITNDECETIYRPIQKHIDRQSICAGYREGLKDSCEGDSGGPMMVYKRGRWVLAGVISWGVGCARPNQPGVSTRVTEFLDWIQSTMDGNDATPVDR